MNGGSSGYAGHRLRAQHCYGRAAYGDPKGVSHAWQLRKRSVGKLERGGEDRFASGFANGEGIDARMKGHPNTKEDAGVWAEGMADYSSQVGGILPGYAGHVPRSIHKFGASAKGNTPQFDKSSEHREVQELRQLFSRQPMVAMIPEGGDLVRSDPNDDGEDWWPKGPPSGAIEGQMTDFRDQINGVVPKYAGHIPRGKDKYGASHYGKTRTVALVPGRCAIRSSRRATLASKFRAQSWARSTARTARPRSPSSLPSASTATASYQATAATCRT